MSLMQNALCKAMMAGVRGYWAPMQSILGGGACTRVHVGIVHTQRPSAEQLSRGWDHSPTGALYYPGYTDGLGDDATMMVSWEVGYFFDVTCTRARAPRRGRPGDDAGVPDTTNIETRPIETGFRPPIVPRVGAYSLAALSTIRIALADGRSLASTPTV
ncbi:hypothetical protein BD779DRAFT_1472922 [Infundibulicybe gibba]|nr:hypothetical protein BD779DRAFT_1472922 [Infundibulicybe gibba]